MSPEQELIEIMSKKMAKEIDEGIMSHMLIEIGWTPVEFYFQDNYHANDVNFWLLEHCKSHWRRFEKKYLFEDVKEAEWFILRWS